MGTTFKINVNHNKKEGKKQEKKETLKALQIAPNEAFLF